MKNHICLLLLVTMLASLSACGGADTPTDTTAASAETTTPTTESPFEPDDLPADLDFGGKEVSIFIGDYIHFVSGRFAIANVKNALALYFNDDLYKSLGKTEDLYELVDSGKWTHAKMKEILKDTYADINGNTERDAADQYGLTYGDENKYFGYLKAFGMDIFVKDGKGYKFTYDNERAVSVMEELVRFVNENEAVMPASTNNDQAADFQISSGGGNYASKLFMEGRAVFSASLIADAATIVPEIDFGYGLLPFPKWDESQKDYATMLQRNCFMLIPVTVEDTDMVSAVMEALASESYRSLLPEYFEVTLKTRYSQDDNVSRMFDLIGGSIVFDPGEIYAGVLGTPSGDIKARISANDPNWVSFIAGKKDSLIEKMNSIIK